MAKKNLWIVEMYDPERDILLYISDPMSEVDALDELIKLDKEFPNYAVSSRQVG